MMRVRLGRGFDPLTQPATLTRKKLNFNPNAKYCLESHVFLISTFLLILSSYLTHCLQISQTLNSLMLPLYDI